MCWRKNGIAYGARIRQPKFLRRADLIGGDILSLGPEAQKKFAVAFKIGAGDNGKELAKAAQEKGPRGKSPNGCERVGGRRQPLYHWRANDSILKRPARRKQVL